MTTINQYISDIRGIIKESGRSEDVYTDSFLYSLLNGARNTILERESNKISYLSEWDWLQFPLKLIKDKSHLVGCVTVGCDIMRTEYKLPRPLASNDKNLLDVTTFDYSTIMIDSEQVYQNNKFDDIKANKPSGSIINDYLIIWNQPQLKNVLVRGIWENILDWSVIPQCDNNGNYTMVNCFDALNSQFKISEKLKIPVYQLVMDRLFPTLNKPKDITNDSNSEIRA